MSEKVFPVSHPNLRLFGVTLGDVADPLSAAGVNYALFSALERHTTMVGVVNADVHSAMRFLVGAMTARRSRFRWRHAFYKNPLGFDLRTGAADQALQTNAGKFNFVLQLKTLCAPGWHPTVPYAIYTDNTHHISERLYPEWDVFWTSGQRQRWYEREIGVYQNASLVFVRSEQVQKSLIDEYGLSPEHIIKVGGGANFEPQLQPNDKVAADTTLLFVGRDFRRKGGEVLLEALVQLRQTHPAVRLRIVGPPEPIVADGVEWLGPVHDRRKLAEVFSQATIFVHPALFEPWGNVILEAMAFGLPCIGTRVGGIPEMIADQETGLLVTPGDSSELALALENLLDCPERATALGLAGQTRVKNNFTWNAIASKMIDAMTNVLSSRLLAQVS